jgi:hypothetical protein
MRNISRTALGSPWLIQSIMMRGHMEKAVGSCEYVTRVYGKPMYQLRSGDGLNWISQRAALRACVFVSPVPGVQRGVGYGWAL